MRMNPLRRTRMLLILLMGMLMPFHGYAASLFGIEGKWATEVVSKIHVSGYGTERVVKPGSCTFVGITQKEATLQCQAADGSNTPIESGRAWLRQGGKAMRWYLDASVFDRIEQAVSDWLIVKAARKGQVLDPATISFEPLDPVYKPIGISQAGNAPRRATVVIKGRMAVLGSHRYVTRRFKYVAQVRFKARLP